MNIAIDLGKSFLSGSLESRNLLHDPAQYLFMTLIVLLNYIRTGTHCTRLKELDLSGCWEVDDSIVSNIVSNHRCLESLSLQKIYNLTDEVMRVVSDSLSDSLNKLSINGCWRISNEGIR